MVMMDLMGSFWKAYDVSKAAATRFTVWMHVFDGEDCEYLAGVVLGGPVDLFVAFGCFEGMEGCGWVVMG